MEDKKQVDFETGQKALELIYMAAGFENIKNIFFEMYDQMLKAKDYENLMFFPQFLWKIRNIFLNHRTEYKALFSVIYDKIKEVICNNFYTGDSDA